MGREEASRQVISDTYADYVGRLGLPASAGRIFAALLTSPVPLTQAQLRSALSLSEGSVSEGLRLLLGRQYIERASEPRARPAYFQVRAEAWADSVHDTMNNARLTYALAQLALKHLDDYDIDGAGLELMARGTAIYEVLVAELPAVCQKALEAGERVAVRRERPAEAG